MATLSKPPKGATKKLTQKALRAQRALEPVPHPGLQFPQNHHVFITRTKGGELWALNQLSVNARGAVTPLFEMVPPTAPRKPKPKPGKPTPKPKPAKSLAQHAKDVLQTIKDEWSPLPFFLDTRYIPLGGIPSPTGAKSIFAVARDLGLVSVPVTSVRLSQDYQEGIRDVVASDKRGVAIRLFAGDFDNTALLQGYLKALMGVLRVSSSEVDIVVDLEYRKEQFVAQQAGVSALSSIPDLSGWRTVTVASGCFPASISNYEYDKWVPIKRVDWLAWLQLRELQTRIGGRIPSYGDYGIRCGGEPISIPNRPDPNIRYSSNESILVRKGEKIDGRIKQICSSLVGRAEFSGANFSQGDLQIAARAAMPGSPNNGQATQWIQWCTNHHLELTASQIRSLP